jgi:hypothetical protein
VEQPTPIPDVQDGRSTEEDVGDAVPPNDENPPVGSGFVYTLEERRKLIACVRSIGEECVTTGMHWSPRSIRAFQFKYQLARMLAVQTTGHSPDVDELLKHLSSCVLRGRRGQAVADGAATDDSRRDSGEDDLLRHIVAQVV